jgi:hypothetical protein
LVLFIIKVKSIENKCFSKDQIILDDLINRYNDIERIRERQQKAYEEQALRYAEEKVKAVCYLFISIRNPGQLDPAVNDRFLSYLTRFIGAVLRPFFVVPYTVSNCRKRPENRVSDRLRSFTIRRNTAVILRL